jgi:hypothetical protein
VATLVICGRKANDPSKINIAGYSDPNIVENTSFGSYRHRDGHRHTSG